MTADRFGPRDEETAVRPTEAWERRAEVQFLDVREPYEWDAGHIAGATHLPMQELTARQDEIAEDRLVVCVCRSGSRSAMVTQALRRAGYEAENLEGGMARWAADDLPYEATGDGPPSVA